jgi:hypothetical protein
VHFGTVFLFDAFSSGELASNFGSGPGQALVRKRSNPLPDLAWSGLAIPVSGFRQAFVRAVHRAAVAGQARAPAAALPDVDCRADPLAAARSAGPVSAAESLEVRSAFTS